MNSVEGYPVTHPENATEELGDHRFDDKLTDYSAEARVQELARAKQTRQQVEGLADLSQLTGFWTSWPSSIPDDNTIVGYAQKIVREATEFTKQRDFVAMPEKPLE